MFFVTTVFNFIGMIALGVPFWVYVLWICSMLFSQPTVNLSVLMFGLFLCIATGAPFWAYIVGFVCIIADVGMMAVEDENESFRQFRRTF